jgi:hypothetical protein
MRDAGPSGRPGGGVGNRGRGRPPLGRLGRVRVRSRRGRCGAIRRRAAHSDRRGLLGSLGWRRRIPRRPSADALATGRDRSEGGRLRRVRDRPAAGPRSRARSPRGRLRGRTQCREQRHPNQVDRSFSRARRRWTREGRCEGPREHGRNASRSCSWLLPGAPPPRRSRVARSPAGRAPRVRSQTGGRGRP